MLIGICGKAGAGKDTIGDYLCNKYNWFKRIANADPIKRAVKDIFVLSDYEAYDRVGREQELKNWPGWTARKLYQFVGTEMFRDMIDQEIWIKSLWLRIGDLVKNDDYVITDLRFPNELAYLKANMKENFVTIKVVRDGCNGVVGLNGHSSEKYDLETDYVVENNGTFEDLYSKVDSILWNSGCKF